MHNVIRSSKLNGSPFMKLSRKSFRAAALAVGLVVGMAGAVHADEVTPEHLAAAKAAVDAAKNFKGFDNLLPLLAQQTQIA